MRFPGATKADTSTLKDKFVQRGAASFVAQLRRVLAQAGCLRAFQRGAECVILMVVKKKKTRKLQSNQV